MFARMTSKITLLVTMAVAQCILLSSCLGSSDIEVTTYDDVAITSFKLGTVKCSRTVKKSDGTDSTYSYTYSAATYPMHIDQRNNVIYNADSLVAGSKVSSVLVTIGTKNGGAVAFKNIDDDGYTLYSSSDSVDLSKDRTVVVYSNDGQCAREYTVKTLVHEEYADSFTWNAMTPNMSAEIAAMKKMKALATMYGAFLLGSNGESSTLLKTMDGETWEQCSMEGIGAPLVADASLAEHEEKLYLLNDGVLYTSEDGNAWSQVTSDGALATIMGGYRSVDEEGEEAVNEMYALSKDARIMVSHDNGATWQQDNMESTLYYDNSEYMPSTDVNFTSVTTRTDDETGIVTIIANKALTEGDTFSTAVVWNKIADRDDQQGWFYTNTAWENHYYILPRMQGLSAIAYADGIVAIGGEPVNNEAKAFSQFYYSPDHGATWHKVDGVRVPEGFNASGAAALIADNDGCIYIISNGDGVNAQVWRGRKNRETWEKLPQLYK